MGVTSISRPDDFSSAYVPLEYEFSSNFAGITDSISNISEDATGTYFITGLATVKSKIKAGGIATISNTTSGLYDGEWTVIDILSNGTVYIDAPYVGDVSGGNFNYTRLNMHMICDLFIDGSFVIRKIRFPNANDNFVFDFSKQLQTALGVGLAPLALGSNTAVISAPSSASIYMDYTESWDFINNQGAAETQLQLDPTPAPPHLFSDVLNPRTIINSDVPYLEWELGSVKSSIINKDTDLSTFYGSSLRFLTNSPKSIPIGLNDSYQLSFIVDYDAAATYKRQILKYDSSGALLATARTTFAPGTDSVWGVPVGSRDLTGASAITSSVAYYEVTIVDTAIGVVDLTEVITFDVDTKCYQSDTRFCWLNPRGGYDAFTVHNPRKLTSSVKKKSYKPTRTYPVVVGNSEEKITDVEAMDGINTGSQKVNKETAEWLQELLESPEVFIELDNSNALHDTRVPVTITNKNTAICDSYNGMFNVNIKYRFAFEKKGLRAG